MYSLPETWYSQVLHFKLHYRSCINLVSGVERGSPENSDPLQPKLVLYARNRKFKVATFQTTYGTSEDFKNENFEIGSFSKQDHGHCLPLVYQLLLSTCHQTREIIGEKINRKISRQLTWLNKTKRNLVQDCIHDSSAWNANCKTNLSLKC